MSTAELPRDDLIRMIRAMQHDIEMLKQRSPLANTGLSATGVNEIRMAPLGRLTFDGGSLAMNDTSDRLWLYAGGFSSFGFGLGLYRTDGSLALSFIDSDPLTEQPQRIRLADGNSVDLIREDSAGSGAAWPLAPIPFAGLSWPTWDSNNAVTWAAVSAAHTVKSSPRVVVTAQALTNGSAVGWVRLSLDGVPVGAQVLVPNLSMIVTTFGPFTVPGGIGDPLDFTLETRLASGAGNCYGRVTSARFAASV